MSSVEISLSSRKKVWKVEVCRSDPNPHDRIRSDFGTKIFISDRIGSEAFFHLK